MTDLYSRHGGKPEPLPDQAFDDQGFSYTPPYAADDLAMLGFVFFADVDLTTHRVVADGGGWKVEPIPAPEPEPEPEPQPISLEMVTLWARMTDDEWDAVDADMVKERARTRNLWRTSNAIAVEGDTLWQAIVRCLDRTGVTPERKAELLARAGTNSMAAAEPIAA